MFNFGAFNASWKTTLLAVGKFLTVLGVFLIALLDGDENTIADLGPVLVAAMAIWQTLDLAQGYVQRDGDKSSQDSRIRPGK